MAKLILASTSSYKAGALSRLGLAFETQAPETDETPLCNEDGASLALRLAFAKADAVASQHENAVVVGADQVGDSGGQFLNKPGSSSAAIEQLYSLSGGTAEFHTAVAVRDSRRGSRQGRVVTTVVEFRRFNRAEAIRYVEMDRPIHCAGSFKIEAAGIALFRRVSSDDPSALVGLPLIALLDLLAECGIKPLQPR